MTDYLIDLTKSPFWIALIAAAVLLAIVEKDHGRSPVFALVNLGFIELLIGWQRTLYVLGGAVVVWAFAVAARRTRYHLWWALLGGGLCVGLFLLHKLPGWSGALNLGGINQLLSVTGFSYIALRIIELLRAMYEKRHDAPGLVATINYLLPFHMLAAGPIQAYDDFATQPDEARVLTRLTVLEALERIAFGIFKKFVLAYGVKTLFLTDFRAGGIYWLFEAQMFFIWLYLDFSAYSDIAVGVGKLIGVRTPENFNRPYFARNITVFWERWHITLSLWIRRNLFFPIQVALMRRTGGKRAMLCAAVAFAVSFLLCGLWHGIAWNFVVWGVMHASGLIIVNVYRGFLAKRLGSKGVKQYLANPYIKAVSMAITFEWVAISHLTFFYRF
jgi:D-alanyl-lipoteichoic acid acyltransferase DltB (MBOAT superfamily)